MRSRKSIKIKAAFLLTVFTLNTLISFACSVGINMGFNHNHHSAERNNESPSQGAKHSHGDDSYASEHTHSHATAHKHLEPIAHHHSQDLVSGESRDPDQKDNCCNDKSIELQKLDKSSIHSSNPVIKIPVFVAFLAAFSGLELKNQFAPLLNKAFIPQYYPPPDMRISIQSFQI